MSFTGKKGTKLMGKKKLYQTHLFCHVDKKTCADLQISLLIYPKSGSRQNGANNEWKKLKGNFPYFSRRKVCCNYYLKLISLAISSVNVLPATVLSN